jgi:hypothetical protein
LSAIKPKPTCPKRAPTSTADEIQPLSAAEMPCVTDRMSSTMLITNLHIITTR